MEIKVRNPKTNQEMVLEISNTRLEDAKEKIEPVIPKKKLKEEIGKLDISSEFKSYLETISEKVSVFGDWSFKVGHKVVELSIAFVKKYPNTSAGLIIGAVIGFLISTIPVIGFLIGWLVTPLSIALGIGIGAWIDMKDNSLKARIQDDVMDIFGTFKDVKAVA
ncbi:hypothetical protein ACFL36_01255 [Thermodesulfobacteriota bacterium]